MCSPIFSMKDFFKTSKSAGIFSLTHVHSRLLVSICVHVLHGSSFVISFSFSHKFFSFW